MTLRNLPRPFQQQHWHHKAALLARTCVSSSSAPSGSATKSAGKRTASNSNVRRRGECASLRGIKPLEPVDLMVKAAASIQGPKPMDASHPPTSVLIFCLRPEQQFENSNQREKLLGQSRPTIQLAPRFLHFLHQKRPTESTTIPR